MTQIVGASTKSAGPGPLCWASTFAALVASRLGAGLIAPSHSTPRRDVDASSFSAGAEIALREQARVASQKSAGLSQSMFADYRQQLEVNSDHASETKSISTQFSTGAHSLALKKVAGDTRPSKKVTGSHAESKKQGGNVQVPGFQDQAENVEVPGFQDQAGNVQVPNYQVSFLNDNFQTNLQPSSGCRVVQNGT